MAKNQRKKEVKFGTKTPRDNLDFKDEIRPFQKVPLGLQKGGFWLKRVKNPFEKVQKFKKKV